MVTLSNVGNRPNRNVSEIVCKSTDTKPTNANGGLEGTYIENGSTLFEMDTSSVYMFDYDNDTWVKI